MKVSYLLLYAFRYTDSFAALIDPHTHSNVAFFYFIVLLSPLLLVRRNIAMTLERLL